ncbi:BTAD domain-containing putative transcriptional regulator [Nonomuraea angiospora]|uniref:AfsR/SARP family transcriptional regulator n=2 Tax=Nonomuraea angiospora TaxID=46172 RepID=UPI003795CD6E
MPADDDGPFPDFRILGPLEISLSRREVQLPGQHVRWLLAVLLLSRGEPVAEGQLLSHVWGTSEASLRALRTSVSRLRSWLRDHTGMTEAVKYTRSGGYVLDLDARHVDAARFLGRYRAAAREPDPALGLDLLLRALAQWRGTVLEGAPEEVRAHAGIRRLQTARAGCAARAADLALHTSRLEAALPHVREVAADMPYEEPLQTRLIRLLGATGRRAEALRCFEEIRRRLADELGVDPSDELRATHAELLREHRPAPGPAAPRPPEQAPPDQARPVAAELPMDVATFTGRRREVEHLCGLLGAARQEGPVVVSISGGGGVGKSALAIHVAHRLAARYPDGQLYLNLHGSTPNTRPVETSAALARLLRSLGTDDEAVPAEVEEAAGQLRSLTAGKRLLIVLDNALDAAQIRHLLPGHGAGAVLLTSRKVLTELDGATHLRLELLPEEDSLALFARLVGRDRVRAETAAAEAVVRQCDHLPLAVCIAAARLNARATWSVRALADRLATDRHRLAELHVGDRALRASFAVGYDELDAGHARLFRLLGLLANADVGVGVAAALAGIPERQAEDVLDYLVDLHMVENHAPRRYRMHDLLRQFAYERAHEEDDADRRAAALRNVLHWYLATARAVCVRVNPDAAWRTGIGPQDLAVPGARLDSHQQIQAWIKAETANFPVVLRQAIGELDDGPSLAVGLAAALYLPLGYERLWKDQYTLQELAADAAGRTGDPLQFAVVQGDLGDVQSQLGQLSDAIARLRDSLDAYRRLRHPRGESSQLDRLAGAYGLLGRYDESIDCYRQALALDRKQGDRFNEGITLSNLGLTYQKAGRFAEAVHAHTESIAIHRETDSPFGLGCLLGNLAEARRLAGRPDLAVPLFREALRADDDAGRSGTYDEAEHWWGLGRCHDDLGESGPAQECRRAAGALLHRLGLIGAQERQLIEAEAHPPTPEIIRRNT